MNKAGTQLVEVDFSDLVKAAWNYKTEGAPAMIQKLAESIRRDRSAGVLAVRELNGKFEVIDGNHRYEAIKLLGWEKVPCENFGEISLAQAIIVARRRNTLWFEEDTLKFAKLFKDEVLKEYSIEELAGFMPNSVEELASLQKILDFNWDDYADNGQDFSGNGDAKEIKFFVPPETFKLWQDWKERVKVIPGYDSDSKAFEFAIIEALNTPIQSLTAPTNNEQG